VSSFVSSYCSLFSLLPRRATYSSGLDLGGGTYPRLGVAPPRTPAAAEEGAEEEEAAKRGAWMNERKESCEQGNEGRLVDLGAE